ncbi:LD-carboxypeptidase [Holospora curviuscula]|uniref:Putative murein peptide carboxypeptidase n=1 Tax=Holospora curviuscula TaxID=1082868 RepID=A0A2S5RHW0_9PROT|nr:LD-carboxypeptidase [Holospora curviuscula]PPE06909.1 putative murein peptide carboxypeptidase [Holospora curviuscula]
MKTLYRLKGFLFFLSSIFSNITKAKSLQEVPIVAPAGSVEAKVFQVLQKNFPQLKKMIWTPPVYWHSASDEDRGARLLKELGTASLWVWCLRGGYGSARIIPLLQAALRQKKLFIPKVFIGYSDITCLHLWADKLGWKGLHAVMPGDWVKPFVHRNNFTLLDKVLTKKNGVLHYQGLIPFNTAAKNSYPLKGKIIGGNLTLLVHSIGTAWQLQGKGKIIIIEDLNVEGYQIDRALYHLVQANVLQGAVAVVFGTFSGKNFQWRSALERFAQNTCIPVFYWPYFGHGAFNYPIPLGFESRLKCTMGTWNWSIPYAFCK